MKSFFILVFFICVISMHFSANAQYAATWTLLSNKSVTVTGSQSPGVSAGNMVPGLNFPNPGSHNTDGYQAIQTLGNWPTVPTDGLHLDFPISPSGVVDMTITSFTLTARTSSSSGNNMISLAYQADGTGPWVPFGTPLVAPSGGTNNLAFNGLNVKFFSGQTYVVRMYIYAQGTGTTTSRSVRVRNVVMNGMVISPAGTQPSVTTNSASATGKCSGNATGTVTAGTLTIAASGVVWSITPNPTVALVTKTTDGPITSGNINSNFSGLTAGTTYYVRAYVTSESGMTTYGAERSFTTLPPTAPELTTNAVTNILSTRATSGGTFALDCNGVPVTEKGVVWSTSPNPTTADNKSSDGTGSTDYSSLMTGLTPSTTYYVRAYAINSIGTGYGNQVTFTTAPPTPIINAVPTALNFGNIAPGSVSQKTYTLSGNVLTPASGNITVTAPAGYQVSLSPGGGFASTINVPYTGGALANTIIYVRFSPNQYGPFIGTITHSGGGASGAYIDHVTVNGFGAQLSSDVSNMGTDFWVGYGYQSLMSGSNNQQMVLYISAKQDAVVTVEVPGIGYTQTYNVQANVALSTLPLPKTAGQDARLLTTGILDRGIHVYSNGVPIAVWAHIYASQSSGATMVLPTNTWGTDYTALTTGGRTNSGIPHSFFFVQAAEDNTVVDITPSADITATASGTTVLYPAGVPFSVTLNKGQVFNALGKLISSNTGVDLTGSVVKARDCKKIALFTGNGRVQLAVGGCTFTDGGSDNFIQQMFPKVAWGSKYLTVPFRDMEAGFLRVVVDDPTTEVKVNGSVLPVASLNQFYYQIDTDTTNLIESNKPVMVAQYCATHRCNGTGLPNTPNTGNYGDPEMIIISPVQQAINDVTVFSATQFAIARNYINVIVKNSGVASFTLDGVNVSAQFAPHPNDPGYSYAVFTDLAGGVSHRLYSNEDFNAIAYGFTNDNDHESYGYNAGTNVKDLNTSLGVENPYPGTATTTGAVTCLGNPFFYTVTLPYKATSLTWDFSDNPNQTPNSIVVQNPATPTDSIQRDGSWLYIFKINTPFTFDAVGTYNVTITADNPTPDGCIGLRTISLSVQVVDKPRANFSANSNGCPSDAVTFTDASNGFGRSINQWQWAFPGGVTSTSQNPTHTFGSPGTYNVSLRAISDIGCFHDTTKTYTVEPLPVASFTAVSQSTCSNTAVTFTSTSINTLGTLNQFTWNYGDGSAPQVVSTNAPVTHSYTTPGTYTATLMVRNDRGCQSLVASNIITVYGAIADFTFTTGSCANVAVQFASTSSTSDGGAINTYNWNFGTGMASIATPTFTFNAPGTYNVTLTIVSARGCTATVTKPVTIVAPISAPVVTVTNVTANSVQFNWTAVAGATAYEVSIDNGTTFITPSSGAMGLTHLVTGLQANQNVTIIVRAIAVNVCQNSTGTARARTLLPDVGIFVANTFTPNGDGRNDFLWVRSNHIQSMNMKIFNQWGELIFTNTDMARGWDGTYKGKQQPVGVYVYVLNATMLDGSQVTKKGSINLIR